MVTRQSVALCSAFLKAMDRIIELGNKGIGSININYGDGIDNDTLGKNVAHGK